MKYSYGRTSSGVLITVSFNLQSVFDEALAMGLIDITAIEGRRVKTRQNRLFILKKSKVQWPDSKHNVLNPEDLAHAVDAAPYVNGKASDVWYHCIYLAGVIQACGEKLGIPIRWGGNWDMDGEPITDQDFQDLWHYEEVL
jgi:peptidoglycan L-alanyl-D-glutamate endopeptidase CwlK